MMVPTTAPKTLPLPPDSGRAADHDGGDGLQLHQVAGGRGAAGEPAQEHPAAEADEQPGQDVDRPQGRLDRDAGAAGGLVVGADRRTPGDPTRCGRAGSAISADHRQIQMMASTGNAEERGLPDAGERRRRRRGDRDAVAVGVDEAAGQGEHAQGDDERLEAAERDQPAVHGADDAADHQGDDKAEQHRRTAEQAGRDDGGQAERGADADVDAAGQHDDQLGQHDDADDRHLQQQVGQVGPTPEDRTPGDGGDQAAGQQGCRGRTGPSARSTKAWPREIVSPRSGAPEGGVDVAVMDSSSFAMSPGMEVSLGG